MFIAQHFHEWLRKQLIITRPEGRCSRLLLRHISQGNKVGNEVHTVAVPAEWDDTFVVDAGNELEAAAHQDAGGLGGPQKYMIFAFFERSEVKPLARFPFLMEANTEEDGAEGTDIDTEPPNTRGLTAQLMRHNEALMRTAMMGITQVVGTLQRQVQKQSEVIEKFVEERFDNLEVMETLMSKKQERDLEMKAAESKQKLLTEGGERLLALAPLIVSKLTGKSVPGSTTESAVNVEVLKAFLGTLTPEQMEGMTKILKPEQAMLVIDLYQKLVGSGEDQKLPAGGQTGGE